MTRTPLARTLLNEKVVLYRKQDGSGVIALGNVCPHRFAPLDKGKLHGDMLACPYHGLQFAESGKCTHNPHGDLIPPTLRVKGYPVQERHGVAWIWMGDPDKAKVDLIPDFSEHGNPSHRVIRGLIPVKGNYQLVADNLLDLSHTQFLHELLTHNNDDGVQHTFEVVQDADKLETFHHTYNTERFGFTNVVWPDGPERTDNYGGIIWRAPANMKLKMVFVAAGADKNSGIRAWGAELVTPETDATCHYFWTFCRDFRLDDSALDAILGQAIAHVFTNEDGWMIGCVQENMGTETDLVAMRPVILPTDNAAIRARRILRNLIRKENDEARTDAAPGAELAAR